MLKVRPRVPSISYRFLCSTGITQQERSRLLLIWLWRTIFVPVMGSITYSFTRMKRRLILPRCPGGQACHFPMCRSMVNWEVWYKRCGIDFLESASKGAEIVKYG